MMLPGSSRCAVVHAALHEKWGEEEYILNVSLGEEVLTLDKDDCRFSVSQLLLQIRFAEGIQSQRKVLEIQAWPAWVNEPDELTDITAVDIVPEVTRGPALPIKVTASASDIAVDKIFIDGANLALGYSPGSVFCWEGVVQAVRYFAGLGFRPIVVMQASAMALQSSAMPASLIEFVTVSPVIESMADADDMQLLFQAKQAGAFFVSNDKYRDFQVGRGGHVLAEWYSQTGHKRHIGYQFEYGAAEGLTFVPTSQIPAAGSNLIGELVVRYRTQLHIQQGREEMASVDNVYGCLTLAELSRIIARNEGWEGKAALYGPEGHPVAASESALDTSLSQYRMSCDDALFVVLHRQARSLETSRGQTDRAFQRNFYPLDGGMLCNPLPAAEACFCATLYSLSMRLSDDEETEEPTWHCLMGLMRELTRFPPLIQGLYVLSKHDWLQPAVKLALFEGLASLFAYVATAPESTAGVGQGQDSGKGCAQSLP